MSDLDRLRAAPVPREAELVRAFARTLEPGWGFVPYAILWLFVAMVVGLLGALLGALAGNLVGLSKGGDAFNGVMWSLGAVSWAASWWPFARWARARRRRAMALIEGGALVDGTVATTTGDRVVQAATRLGSRALGGGGMAGVRWYRVVFEAEGAQHFVLCPFHARPDEGSAATVLFHPASTYAFAFDPDGRAFVGKVHRR